MRGGSESWAAIWLWALSAGLIGAMIGTLPRTARQPLKVAVRAVQPLPAARPPSWLKDLAVSTTEPAPPFKAAIEAAEAPRVVQIRLNVQPRLAALGRPVKVKPTTGPAPRVRVENESDRLALKPARLQPTADAELALPPPTGQSDATALPLGQIWQRPDRLLAQLECLSLEAPYSTWATNVSELLLSLTGEPAPAIETRAALLGQLTDCSAQAASLAAQLSSFEALALLRRVESGLERRLNIWHRVLAAERAAGETPLVQLPNPAPRTHLAGVFALGAGEAGRGRRESSMLESLGRGSDYRTAALDADLRSWAAASVNMPKLLARLERYEEQGLTSAGNAAAADLGCLQLSSLAEHRALGLQIDQHYRGANLRLVMSQALLNRLISQPGAEENKVSETILGRPVRGTSKSRTQLQVRLLPDENRLRMFVEAEGEIASRTSSSASGVTLLNSCQSSFTARKEVEVTPRGLRSQPAQVAADSQSRLRGVQTPMDAVPLLGVLMQVVAASEYDRQRDAARQEMSQKIAARAGEQIDETLDQHLAAANRWYQSRLVQPLRGLGLEPTWVEARGTHQRFTVRMRVATEQQLAAATPRPRALDDSLFSLQLHESLLDNVIDRLELGGRKFTGAELYQHLVTKLDLPRSPEAEEAFRDVELTFAERDPVAVRCDAGRLEMTLSLAQLKSGSRQWRDFEVSVAYVPQPQGPAIELVRDGPISLSGERLNMQAQFILRGTFNRIFSEDHRFAILKQELGEQAKLAGLQITQFIIDDGWFAMALGPRREGRVLITARNPSQHVR